jgi:putative transposase
MARLVKPGASQSSERWSMDLVNDCVSGGKVIRMLTIADDYTRECPALEVVTSPGGLPVRRVLDRMASECGLAQAIICTTDRNFADGHWRPGANNVVCDWISFSQVSPRRIPTTST